MGLVALGVTVAGFLSGSLMFSAWLVSLRGRDIGKVGDRNPGAVNAFKAGGAGIGIAALWLDFLKGAVPVALAKYLLGVEGFWLVPVALAPVLGHAFSPFLKGRGGKAVAVTFGIWCGLTLWEGPTVLGVLLGLFGLIQATDGWTVILAMLGFLGYWVARGSDPVHVTVWTANLLVLLWTHREALRKPMKLRRRFSRRKS
jgi:glycerol-3-phosphate acyltransferase PlsY